MAENNSISIGGVKFNKADIKSSEVIKQDGKTMNSVFLKDGTHIVFPNQAEKNGSSVTQENLVTYKPKIDYGISWQNDFEPDFYIKNERTEHPDKKITTFNKMAGAQITGTENEDRYDLYGCNNSTVDVSQNDGKKDNVTVKDHYKSTSLFGSETFESSGNKVKLGDGDIATTKKEHSGWLESKYKQVEGPKTVKEK